MEERKMYRTKENLHQNFPSGKWDEEIGKTEVDPYSPLWRAEGRQSKMNWFQPILTGPEGKIFNTNSATCR
jgi:hypothetical protein